MDNDKDDLPRIKQLLAENQRLLIENNTILRKMRRDDVLARIFRVITFLVVLGSMYYLYMSYIEPNWQSLKLQLEKIESISTEAGGVKEWFSSLNREEVTE